MLRMDTTARGCELRIGTSGYDYPEWRGKLYAPGLPRASFLEAYGESFSTLELNFSYYGMPRAASVAALLARASSRLDFSIKAHRSLTHEVDPATWRERAAEFRTGIEPLARSGRLASILLEFPASFHYEPERRRYLDRLLAEFAPYPLVTEFRRREWFNARLVEGLRARGVALCALDLPRLEGGPPLADLLTADLAYLRCHGRRAETWWTGDSAGRYDYFYSGEELSGLADRVEVLAAGARKLRVYFNNHARGQAVDNARGLLEILEARGFEARPGDGAGAPEPTERSAGGASSAGLPRGGRAAGTPARAARQAAGPPAPRAAPPSTAQEPG